MNQETASEVPVVRAGNLTLQVAKMQPLGVSIDRLLARSGIPEEAMEAPELLISLPAAIQFLDHAARDAGVVNLGLHTGENISIGDLGLYGEILDRSVTVHDYLRLGIPLYSSHSNAEYFWLQRKADCVRLHHELRLEPGLGTMQSDLNAFAIIINKFREALGSYWVPRKISLAWKCQAPIRRMGLENANLVTGNGVSYIELTHPELQSKFPVRPGIPSSLTSANADEIELVPVNLVDVVAMQLERILLHSRPNIQFLAEILGLRPRTLQHHLTQAGLSYRSMLSEARFRLATDWLAGGEKPISVIAHDLGYEETANFCRAFGKMAGISPTAFRQQNPTKN